MCRFRGASKWQLSLAIVPMVAVMNIAGLLCLDADVAAKATLPEFFGIYVVSKSGDFEELMQPVDEQPHETLNDIKYLLYDRSVQELYSNAHLVRMRYVDRITDYSQDDTNPTISPIGEWRVVLHAQDKSSEEIALGVKPVPDNEDMVYLVPRTKLSPGAYALVFGQLKHEWAPMGMSRRQFNFSHSFFVGAAGDIAKLKSGADCIAFIHGKPGGGWESFYAASQKGPQASPCLTNEQKANSPPLSSASNAPTATTTSRHSKDGIAPMQDDDLRNAIAGKTIDSENQGFKTWEYYMSDGSLRAARFKYFGIQKSWIAGKWWVDRGQLCREYPSIPFHSCVAATIESGRLVSIDTNGGRVEQELLSGNPHDM